jgi:hypothetical protein
MSEDRIIPDPIPWEPACAERHMGAWLYEPTRFRSLAAAAIAGTLPPLPIPGGSGVVERGVLVYNRAPCRPPKDRYRR